jgi:predicted permease
MATTQFVSEDAWAVLRVPPALGRVFAPDDGRHGAAAVAVVSWDFWQQRLGADPGVIEKTIRIDGRDTRIVGVAARGFFGIEPGTVVDAWRPAGAFDPGGLRARTVHWAHLVGRLADDATLANVQARLQAAFLADRVSRAGTSTPLPSSADAIAVRPAATGLSGSRQALARPLGILLAIATVTLLIASANVGSLLLARASARAVEMAVRTSLGAGRARLVRQLATEHLVLALAAGVVGWTVAWLAGPSLAAVLSRGRDPLRLALTMDVRVLLFSAGVCALSCVFFGLLPAIATMSHAPMPRLRVAPVAGARAGLGRTLMAAQVAFAYCLVASGAAFVFSMSNLSAIDPGFDDRGVTVLTVGADRMMALPDVQQFQQRIGALPGVESAAVAWWAIFEGSRRTDRVVIPGAAPSEREEIFYRVSPEYFATLRTPLVEGRDFTFGDTDAAAPIPTIVNGAFARRYFGGDAVLGREFQRLDGARHRIVGLAADSSYGDLRNGPDPIAYFPMKPPRWFTLYVRSRLDVGTVAQMVRRETAAIGSGAHLIEAVTLRGLVGSTIHRERLLAGAGAAFAGLALLLAAIGVFGFLNYAVSARAREIAIRAALGASPRSIVQLVLTNVLGPVGLGIVAGTLGSTIVLRLGQSLLFGVRAVDPVVLTAATVVFLAAAGAAAALPARRAASVDPTGVLKA